jgi:hypothetical protein
VSSGQETTQCLVGLNVIVQYIEQKNPQFPCRGGHNCDEAMFDVYLNTTLIGVANLNNGGCYAEGCDRKSSLVVTQDMVNSIVNKPGFNNRMTLWYRCKSSNCHSSVPEIYIYNDKKTQLFPNTSFPSSCVAPQGARGDKANKILMFLDGCGNPISVDQTTSAEEMKKLSDEMMSPSEKYWKEQTEFRAKFFNDIQTKGFSFVPNTTNTNVFDQNTFDISEMNIQDNMLFITVIPKKNITVRYFLNPYTNRPDSYFAKEQKPFKVFVPIVPINVTEKERLFKGPFLELMIRNLHIPSTEKTFGNDVLNVILKAFPNSKVVNSFCPSDTDTMVININGKNTIIQPIMAKSRRVLKHRGKYYVFFGRRGKSPQINRESDYFIIPNGPVFKNSNVIKGERAWEFSEPPVYYELDFDTTLEKRHKIK